ncbi:MAG TPA: DUF992 domain-containing protein [Stellaceae bacterium]|nr:DUF992 domain-containing protein [Stellaceae bacterium]
MKMNRVFSLILAVFLAAPMALLAASGEARADGSVILGFLTCSKTGPGNTYVVFSRIPVSCEYDGVGGPQSYSGTAGILFGLDLEYENQAGMIYAVIGGTGVSPGGLAGSYGGAKASVTLGLGPAVQGGLAGVGSGFELVPLGLGGQVGVGFTGGISYLQIAYVTPVASPAPPMMAPSPAPAPAPAAAVPPGQTLIVFFDFDKATLTPAGRGVVNAAIAAAKQGATVRIQVNGYTDTSGTKKYNLGLSKRRADTVTAALVGGGIAANRIQSMGYGEENLRVQTPNGVREPQNRRVEILVSP